MNTYHDSHVQKKILIAEDNPVVAKTLQLALDKIGCQTVGVAADGELAIKMAFELRPDVILMDIQMPKIDGLQAAARILEHHSVPIIIVTSHQEKSFVQKAGETGVAAFLTKPPKAGDIERAITIALARHADLEELRRLNAELKKALSEIKTLQGIIPICASCKKIRDDKGYWEKLESYISHHSGAEFTHGICPDCVREKYPDLADQVDFK
jgi:YesN/AraC family two-component response regulator